LFFLIYYAGRAIVYDLGRLSVNKGLLFISGKIKLLRLNSGEYPNYAKMLDTLVCRFFT